MTQGTLFDVALALDPRLWDYQVHAVEHLRRNPRALLALDMGLGKSCVVLQALTDEHLPALVVAPLRVVTEVWPQETATWRPDLSVEVAHPTARRLDALSRPVPADITVMTRDTLAKVPPRRFNTVVLDELSGFKSKSTERWKNARRLTAPPMHVWGLTGTPAPNGLHDLWAQIFLLDGGARLGGTLAAYRDAYFTPGRRLPSNNIVIEWRLRPGAEVAIPDRIADIALSMSAADYLTLPPVTFNTVTVPIPKASQDAYDTMKATLVADLRATGGHLHAATSAAGCSQKLRQLTAGFLYGDSGTTHLHSQKLDALKEIIDGTGSPVLVFYQFIEEREMIQRAIPEAQLVTAPGAVAAWNAGQVPVLLAHPASAGHGLNLQAGGHTAVWTSLPWSLEEWQQANARLHRQNQRNPVMIHVLAVSNSVDEAVYAALRSKASVQDALLDYLGVS